MTPGVDGCGGAIGIIVAFVYWCAAGVGGPEPFAGFGEYAWRASDMFKVGVARGVVAEVGVGIDRVGWPLFP